MTRKVLLKDLPKQQTLGSGPNTRQEELEARFRAFHAKNPVIFKWFMHHALRMQERCPRHSAYAIMNLLRYGDREFGTRNSRHEVCKSISNDLVPYYARLAMETDSRLEGFFTTRRLTTEDKRPHNFGGEA